MSGHNANRLHTRASAIAIRGQYGTVVLDWQVAKIAANSADFGPRWRVGFIAIVIAVISVVISRRALARGSLANDLRRRQLANHIPSVGAIASPFAPSVTSMANVAIPVERRKPPGGAVEPRSIAICEACPNDGLASIPLI